MRLLFDTHALLWWLGDDDRLGPRVRALVEDPGNDVLVSAVSLREVADAVERESFVLLGINAVHSLAFAGLSMHHRDPFDRLLITQAISEGATIVYGYPGRGAA